MKWILRILILFVLIATTACQSAKDTKPLKRLTLNLQEGDPPTLNPYVGIDLRSRCLFLALYEPLLRRNAEGNLDFAAAQSVDIDPTKTIYTFHLRAHSWSNGEPVTSYHFANAWKYALTPGTFCVRADLLYNIKNGEQIKKGLLSLDELKIFTPDEKTLVVELEHPTPYFLDLTATSFFSPLYETGSSDPVCFNGPFIVKERARDQRLVLSKNPLYWDRASVSLEEVYFNMVKDPMSAYLMYEQGDLDLVGDPFSALPIELIPGLEASGKLKSRVISRIFYLLLNTTDLPLNHRLFRKALGMSIDREKLSQYLFFGEIPSYSPLPQPLSLLGEDSFFKEDARALLEQALEEMHLTREQLPKIVFSYAELSGQKRLAEFLQSQWKENLGLEIEVKCFQWNHHIGNLRRRNYQIGTLHLTTIYQDPMFYFDCFKDKTSFSNYTGWELPDFRTRLDQVDHTIDLIERTQLLKAAELQLFQEMPAIPLFTQNLQYLVKDGIDLVVSDLGIYDFKKIKVRD